MHWDEEPKRELKLLCLQRPARGRPFRNSHGSPGERGGENEGDGKRDNIEPEVDGECTSDEARESYGQKREGNACGQREESQEDKGDEIRHF